MLTKVQIISNALLLLGHQPISSLTDGDQLVVAAESMYDLKLPSILAEGNWRFATTISQLTQLDETPPYPWKSVFMLPAGWLKVLRLIPNIYNWDIYRDDRIWTWYNAENGQPLLCEYVYQPDVSMLPPHFVDYFIYEIAAPLALSNAQSSAYFQALEAKRISMMAIAHAVETQNRPQFVQVSFPVLNNRYISTLIGNSFSL